MGAGQGKALRESVTASLRAQARRDGVRIHATAVNARLAEIYLDEVPEFVDHGRNWIGGRRLSTYSNRGYATGTVTEAWSP